MPASTIEASMTELTEMPEEQRLCLLINAVTDYAIYMLDSDGRIVTWNPGAERFKGYSADEIIGQHFSKFFTDEDRARDFPARALRIAAREGRFEAEGWRVRKDGTRFWAHSVVDPVRAEDGTLLGFAKVTRDVTAKRDQETALFESEQRFRMLVQGVKDYAIYMLDTEGRITNWNAGAQAIKGYSADEVVGGHFSKFYTEEDRRRSEPKHALDTALREGKYEREAWRVRKDGTLFWAHVLIDPIFDENGRHIGFAKVTRDATESKKAQEQLRETEAALAQSQRLNALGELAGGIAHDFNNLMTVILGSTDFLRRKPDIAPEKRAQYLDAIFETGTRAARLTDDLLAFGRRRPLREEVVDTNATLSSMSQILSRTLPSNITVALDLAPSVGTVEVDVGQLEMAILNAAVNARDAMPNGGHLTIATSLEQANSSDCVRIDVKDTGLGMPPRVAERAFDPFFTTKEVGEGTGLGLSQIHGFAAQAGGHAEIDSEEGSGTTISIILPLSNKDVTEAGEQSQPTSIPAGTRVLLVEDNDQVRRFAEELLRDLGCEVTAATTAQQALDVLAKSTTDIVLTDIIMPGMSGIELAQQVRKLHPNLPIVLATGYSDEVTREGSQFPVVLKPYAANDIATALGEALTDHSAPAQTVS
jgi:PAS domain S-box-containing protein